MSVRSSTSSRRIATTVLCAMVALGAGTTSAAAQPASALTVEAMTPDLRLAPLPGRRTANGFGRSFCSVAAAQEPLRTPDVRMGRMRDLLSLRALAGGEGRLDLNPAHLVTVARLVCQVGSDPNLGPWLVGYEQALINGLDLDDAALDALVAAALTQDGRRWSLPCGEGGEGRGPASEGGRARFGGGVSATPDQVIFERIEPVPPGAAPPARCAPPRAATAWYAWSSAPTSTRSPSCAARPPGGSRASSGTARWSTSSTAS